MFQTTFPQVNTWGQWKTCHAIKVNTHGHAQLLDCFLKVPLIIKHDFNLLLFKVVNYQVSSTWKDTSLHELALKPTCFCFRYVTVTIISYYYYYHCYCYYYYYYYYYYRCCYYWYDDDDDDDDDLYSFIHSFILIALHPCIGNGDWS